MLAQELKWEENFMEEDKKHVLSITLEDLGGSDYTPYLKKNKQFGYDLIVEDENGVESNVEGIHPCAIDSIGYFCRRFLMFYDNLNK